MIKYLGSKRRLVPDILRIVQSLDAGRRVLDVFSGTARVGHALKRVGCEVTANDHLTFAWVLARCYVQADRRRVMDEVRRRLPELHSLPPAPGYVTATFCERARYFHPRNGARIDAVRARLAELSLDPDVEAVLLVSLMEAADRVDSTTGVQMAYLKRWAPRALKPLELREPAVLPGAGRALCLDALEAAAEVEADVAYLDPPYNQHSYLGNYHVWETLVRWDAPEVYGVARKRADCRDYRSPFNSKRQAAAAFARLACETRAPRLIVSFSDEGYLGRGHIEKVLAARGHVVTFAVDSRRYVGAQIGIHDPQGRRVGAVSHLRNREYLYVVTPLRAEARRVAELGIGQE